jgi:hypothetical protein
MLVLLLRFATLAFESWPSLAQAKHKMGQEQK